MKRASSLAQFVAKSSAKMERQQDIRESALHSDESVIFNILQISIVVLPILLQFNQHEIKHNEIRLFFKYLQFDKCLCLCLCLQHR